MPHSIVIVYFALFVWIIFSTVVLAVILFVLRYIQTTHAEYVRYFSNYTLVAPMFFAFTLANTALVFAGFLPAILNKAAVLDGIRQVDARMYTALTAQSECIVGLNVCFDIF